MSKSCARPVTPEEFEHGYVVCNCGKYAHVFRAAILAQLPNEYNGELCEECSCLMVTVEMLMPNAMVSSAKSLAGEASAAPKIR